MGLLFRTAFKKFSPELENVAIKLTGKEQLKIFYVYTLPPKSVCEEVEKEHDITMAELGDVLKDFIKLARRNVKSGRYPYSPASPLRSLLQTLIDLEFM